MVWLYSPKLLSKYDYERKAAMNELTILRNPFAIEALVEAFKYWEGDTKAQSQIVDHFEQIGAVEPLLLALRGHPIVREQAAKALAKLIDSKALEPQIQAMKDKGIDVRRLAAEALGRIEDPIAVEPRIQALKATHFMVRSRAAKDLGEIGDSKAIEPLIQAMEDKNENVRRAAAEALIKIFEKKAVEKAVEPLILALESYNIDVRKAAVEALGKIGDSTAAETLIQALKDKDEDSYVREAAAKALEATGKIGDPTAAEPLIQALKDKDEDSYVREAAAKALEKLIDSKDLELLQALKERAIRALKDTVRGVRRSADEALKKIGDPKAIEPLILALKSDHKSVREAAAKALGEIGDPMAVKPLILALKDKPQEGAANTRWDLIECAKSLVKLGANKKDIVADSIDALISYPRPKWKSEKDSLFKNLFGDYTNLILNAGCYTHSKKTLGKEDPITYDVYNVELDAVKSLCNINSPVSTNILIKLSKMKDIETNIIIVDYMGTRYETSTLSFEPIRSLSQQELRKRGYPPYDPSVYLVDGAWNISPPEKIHTDGKSATRSVSRSTSEEMVCDQCGSSGFDFNGYWKEYSCKKCGWIRKK